MKTRGWVLLVLGLIGGDLAWMRAENFTQGLQVPPSSLPLGPGEYVWRPEASPAGPVVILVSIPQQTLYVYRNGVRIGRSTVSTGRPGHDTPTGVFTILEKNVKHTSTIYKGASMPYMERLTWGGIALHAGNLPGYPASHGCVRLPLAFSQKLYTVTTPGTTVVISGGSSEPKQTVQPGLLLGGNDDGDETDDDEAGFVWTPEKSASGPVSIIYSAADRRVFVYRNGIEIGRSEVGTLDPGEKKTFGNHVYVALDQTDVMGHRQWSAVGQDDSNAPSLTSLGKQLEVPDDFLENVRAVVVPGTTLVVTDMSVNPGTKSKKGFNILTTESKAPPQADPALAPPAPET